MINLNSNESPITAIANRKRDLFRTVLKREFLQEFRHILEVVNGRAKARNTLIESIVEQVRTVTPYIPVVGEILDPAVNAVGTIAIFAANRRRDEKLKTIANLADQLDLFYLGILLDVVAREALRRYESFIVDQLSDNHTNGVIIFAQVGALRMVEYLSRNCRVERGQTKVELNESILLKGLIEGRSGSWVKGLRNNKLELKRETTDFIGRRVPDTISAEVVYGRSGFRRFEMEGDSRVDELYIRHAPSIRHQMTQRQSQSFGYAKFRTDRNYEHDPKAGYVLMPSAVIGHYE